MSDSSSWKQWVVQTEASPAYAADQAKLDFAVSLERRMLQLGINRAELARRLGTSAAAVTMALRGDANLTLERMARMTHALDAALHVHVAPRETRVRWYETHQPAANSRYTNDLSVATNTIGGAGHGTATVAA